MIYISVQPDEPYFLWQLELLLRNLHSFGVTASSIHVLIAFDENEGPSRFFRDFEKNNSSFASFYCYPDLRVNPRYASSIRPNILKQHFSKFKNLEKATIFYHDSDILFSRLPVLNQTKSNICYVSDTRKYLSAEYIRQIADEKLLEDMAEIVGISKSIIEKNDHNSGGAQYILKNITADFWQKIETDAENLYVLMSNYNWDLWENNYRVSKEFRSQTKGIKAWCADMWAILWNLWLSGRNVQIHPELEFSWPFSPISEWREKAIQHYSGSFREGHSNFSKTNYIDFPPWYDEELERISHTTCSYKIVEKIKERRAELDAERISFENIIILITLPMINDDTLNTLKIQSRYIKKSLNVQIAGFANEAPTGMADNVVNQNNWRGVFEKNKKLSRMLVMSGRFLLGVDDIIKIFQITDNEQIKKIKVKKTFKIDFIFKEYFRQSLNIQLFHLNHGKFQSSDDYEDIFMIEKDAIDNYSTLDNIISRSKELTSKVFTLDHAYDISDKFF